VITSSGKIAVDRSHGEDFDVSGFTNMLESQGWTVTELPSGPLTSVLLADQNVLLIPPDLLTPFSDAEADSVAAWVAAGRGLWAIQEFGSDQGPMNAFASRFGVAYEAGIILDPVQNRGFPEWPNITDFAVHAIFDQVQAYGYYGGVCVTATSPAVVLAHASSAANSPTCGPAPGVMATATIDHGRVVFTGDASPLHPSYFPDELDASEQRLLENIANYLRASGGPTAAARSSWARLKAMYH
jgi:hypothetical protein